MTSVSTLSDLFNQAQLPFRVYHLGRRVMPCSRAHFSAFEQETVAWELPFKSEARIALVIDSPTGNIELSRIWCLAFPLDEQGQLQPAARDHFLHRLLEAGLDASLHGQHEPQRDPMNDNPLAHAPDKMARALLHAWLCRDSGLPLSADAQRATAYILAPQASSTSHWSTLSLQGVADGCVRLDDEQREQLARALPQLADEVIATLCQCLEHVPCRHDTLAAALKQRTAHHDRLRALGIRAVASTHTAAAAQWLDELLASGAEVETLAAISLRGWHHLEHAERLPIFLNALASHPQVNLRDTLHDLALIPRLRLPVIMTLQKANASTPLGKRLIAMGLNR